MGDQGVKKRRPAAARDLVTLGWQAPANQPASDRATRATGNGRDGDTARQAATYDLTTVPRFPPGTPLDGEPVPLPYRAEVRRLFAPHRVDDIQAHVGGAARDASRRMGAWAFATRNRIAFREPPNLWTTAHEVAHVLQQRRRPTSDGVGAAGGPMERHADRVADVAAAGQPVGELVSKGMPHGPAPAVQLARTGAGGCAAPGETIDERRDERMWAGGLAHKQLRSRFSPPLAKEIEVPRATKTPWKGKACPESPPFRTQPGFVDLLARAPGAIGIGEIKSIAGRKWAVEEAACYVRRAREALDRVLTRSEEPEDEHFLLKNYGPVNPSAARAGFLSSTIKPPPGELVGPFWGNPLKKTLHVQLEPGGAVLYWCNERRLNKDEEQQERLRLQIPQGQDVRSEHRKPERDERRVDVQLRHVIGPGDRVYAPLYRTVLGLRPRLPDGHLFAVGVSQKLHDRVLEVIREQNLRRQLDPLRNVGQGARHIHGMRLASMVVADIAVGGIALAMVLPALASEGAGVGATSGAAASGSGAEVIPLLTASAGGKKVAAALAAAAALAIPTAAAADPGTAPVPAPKNDESGARAPAAPPVILLDVTRKPSMRRLGYLKPFTTLGTAYRAIGYVIASEKNP